MKIGPVGAELFHVDGQTDRHDESNTGCIKMIRSVLKLIILTCMVNRIINTSRNERVTQQSRKCVIPVVCVKLGKGM